MKYNDPPEKREEVITKTGSLHNGDSSTNTIEGDGIVCSHTETV